MKIKILSAFTLLLIVSTVVIYSCKKKSDTPTTIPPSTSADYAGTWSTTSKCTSPVFSNNYTTTITASGSSAVVLANFHASTGSTNGYTLSGTISDKTITIPNQTVNNAQGGQPLTFSGSGTLTPPSSLSITYTAKDPSSSAMYNCTATCTK